MRWDIAPSNEEVTLLMEAGLAYRDAGKYQEASDVFTGVRALAPQSEVPEVALGTVSFHQADFADAVKHYNRALEVNPKSAYAHAHLGEAHLFLKDKDAALQHLKKAVELDPRGESGKMARSYIDFAATLEYR
ncbi:MAG: tetratricopeptide repeat protein [Bryobacteraceae bacterium]